MDYSQDIPVIPLAPKKGKAKRKTNEEETEGVGDVRKCMNVMRAAWSVYGKEDIRRFTNSIFPWKNVSYGEFACTHLMGGDEKRRSRKPASELPPKKRKLELEVEED